MAMLKKALTVPGSQIRVKTLKANTAGLGEYNRQPGVAYNDTKPALDIYYGNFEMVRAPSHKAHPGDVLTVMKAPRKIRGVNYCRVQFSDGREGEAFWTELYGNCENI